MPEEANFNGPMAGFRISYTEEGKKETQQVEIKNIEKIVLKGLKKWIKYGITVSIWNSEYYGPESSIIFTKTGQDGETKIDYLLSFLNYVVML